MMSSKVIQTTCIDDFLIKFKLLFSAYRIDYFYSISFKNLERSIKYMVISSRL